VGGAVGGAVALAVAYVALAKFGLGLSPVGGFATLVWAPAGISLAALLLGGCRLWPGVALGALVANLLIGAPPLVACGIAVGNTLEAVLGAAALQRLPGFRASLERIGDVVGLVVLVVLLSTVVSATLGAAGVVFGGLAPRAELFLIWRTWWVGDVIGELIVTPVLLTWARRPLHPARLAGVAEATALGALLVPAAALVFFQRPESVAGSPILQPYVLFFPVLWAALRFGVRGGASSVLAVAVAAIWGTYTGHGPFVRATIAESLTALHVFLASVSLASLALGAVVEGRERSRSASKRIERRLRVSEERQRLAVEAASVGTWCFDIETSELVWSALCRTMYGVGPDEELTYARFLAALEPDDREATHRASLRSITEGTEYRIEHRVVGLDGRVRWLSVLGRPFYDTAGAPQRMLGVTLDVTAQKRADEERAELLARAQLARAEAQAATRAKDDFLAIVSHELRTPLQAMLGWTRILRAPGRDPAALEKGLATIERNVETQAQLIEDLLDVSRIVAGKLRVERRHIDVATVVETAVEAARGAAAARGIRLEATLAPLGGEVLGDPCRLQQVVSNLLTNALKFTPPGGRIGVRVERAGAAARIVVEDSGRGISPEFLPHVFDRFRQEERTVAGSPEGLGLGLAIVRHLVEAHGGMVCAESPGEGRGATFTVTLPLACAERDAPTPERRRAGSGAAG
jgi:PAS domain S-box-containing protein